MNHSEFGAFVAGCIGGAIAAVLTPKILMIVLAGTLYNANRDLSVNFDAFYEKNIYIFYIHVMRIVAAFLSLAIAGPTSSITIFTGCWCAGIKAITIISSFNAASSIQGDNQAKQSFDKIIKSTKSALQSRQGSPDSISITDIALTIGVVSAALFPVVSMIATAGVLWTALEDLRFLYLFDPSLSRFYEDTAVVIAAIISLYHPIPIFSRILGCYLAGKKVFEIASHPRISSEILAQNKNNLENSLQNKEHRPEISNDAQNLADDSKYIPVN